MWVYTCAQMAKLCQDKNHFLREIVNACGIQGYLPVDIINKRRSKWGPKYLVTLKKIRSRTGDKSKFNFRNVMKALASGDKRFLAAYYEDRARRWDKKDKIIKEFFEKYRNTGSARNETRCARKRSD